MSSLGDDPYLGIDEVEEEIIGDGNLVEVDEFVNQFEEETDRLDQGKEGQSLEFSLVNKTPILTASCLIPFLF